MAKGPLVTDAVEALIAGVYQKHPKWKAPEVRNEVSHLLRKDNPKLPSGWPSLSAVQKVLANVRRKAKDCNPQKKPWSMATLDEYPIPPEAVPSVLKVWKYRIENDASLTIGEAKWAARLSGLLEDIEKLSFNASIYANAESIFALAGRIFDSTELDKKLMGLPQVPTKEWGYFISLMAQLDSTEQRQEILVRERDNLETKLAQKELAIQRLNKDQEFIELVQHQGGVPDNKKGYKIVEDFWASIRDEWVKKYPMYEKDECGYLQWEQVQTEYERIIEEQKKEVKP